MKFEIGADVIDTRRQIGATVCAYIPDTWFCIMEDNDGEYYIQSEDFLKDCE